MVANDEASKIEADNVIVINPEENSEEESQLKAKMEERCAEEIKFACTVVCFLCPNVRV